MSVTRCRLIYNSAPMLRRRCLHLSNRSQMAQTRIESVNIAWHYETRRPIRVERHRNGPRSSRRHESAPGAPSRITPKAAMDPRENALTSIESHDTELMRNDTDSVLDKVGAEAAKSLISSPVLVVCRQIEMLNVFIGFEQSNKYIMYDGHGRTVGYIAEDSQTMTSTMIRNLAGTHRPFSCIILDAAGTPVLKVQRPFAFLNSYIKILHLKDDQETLIGEVRQRFHMLRRKYELFLNRNDSMVQFGAIDEPTLSWDFSVKDEHDSIIGNINRNMRGLMRELFTDTGHYVIRMSQTAVVASEEHAGANGESSEAMQAIANTQARALERREKTSMAIDERAVLLTTAIAIDFDYFSKMSNSPHSTGMGMPLFFPMGSSAGTGEAGSPQPDIQGQNEDAVDPNNSSNTATYGDQATSQNDEASSSTGQWWETPEQQPEERNWWDEQSPSDSNDGGGWFDGFED